MWKIGEQKNELVDKLPAIIIIMIIMPACYDYYDHYDDWLLEAILRELFPTRDCFSMEIFFKKQQQIIIILIARN